MNINEKLLKIQQNVSGIKKEKGNPFFKSRYFDINQLLNVIKPMLNDLKVVIIQPLTNIDGQPAIMTKLIDTENNETMEWTTPLIMQNTDPQKAGSSVTYFRRYALQSLLALEALDDDGNMGSGNTVNRAQPAPHRR
jgi:hypothetical protein